MLLFLRDNLRRADAFVSTAARLVERSWGGEVHEEDEDDEQDQEDDGVLRRQNHVEYLVEAAKLAVRGAIYIHR